MDYTTYLWFSFLNGKIDLILQRLENADPIKIGHLKANIDSKATQLQAAINAAKIDLLNPFKEKMHMAAVPAIDDLVASVAALDTVITSAEAALGGIAARIQAAVDAALAGGATLAQLQPLVTLKTDIDTRKQSLAAAIAANTPA